LTSATPCVPSTPRLPPRTSHGRFRFCTLCSQTWHCRCSCLPRHGSRASTFLPPFLSAALLSARLAAHHRCSTMRVLTPADARTPDRPLRLLRSAFQISNPQPHRVPSVAFTATSARSVGPVSWSRLRPYPRRLAAARRRIGSSSCRLPVRLRLLPTPFVTAYSSATATQLPSATCAVASHGKDSHFADRAYSRTHDGRRPRRPFRASFSAKRNDRRGRRPSEESRSWKSASTPLRTSTRIGEPAARSPSPSAIARCLPRRSSRKTSVSACSASASTTALISPSPRRRSSWRP